MTAESDVSALLSHATNAASSLAGSSSALVNAAITTIQKTVRFPVPPPPTPSDSAISMGGEDALPDPKPGFPPWPELLLDPAPALRDLDTIDAAFTTEFPELTFPAFDYPAIAGLPEFDFVMPAVDSAVTLPDLPSLEVGFTPDRMDSLPIVTPTLTLPDTTFTPIDTTITFDPNTFPAAYAQFKTDIFGGVGGLPGLDSLLIELRALTHTALDILLPDLMTLIRARLTDRYSPVLAYQAELQQRLIDRLDAERDRVLAMADDQDRSGWTLPAAARQALQAAAEQVAQAWRSHALSQHDTKTMELSLAFFEATGDLFENLYGGYLALRKGAIEQVLEAHRLSLAYAKQSIAALLAQYEAENFTRNEIEQKKAEAELAVFEAELKVAMTRYEIAKAQLEAEQGRLENDSHLIKLYQADLTRADLDVKLYAAQVAAARSEAEVNSLPQEVFALQVRMFDALINAHESKVRAYLAEVATNEAVVDGELAKVKAFEAEAQAFNSLITAKAQLTEAQAGRNKQVVDEFSSLVKTELARIEQSSLKDQYGLAAYEVQLEDVLADAKLALKKLSVDLEYDNRKVAAEQQALDTTNQRSLALVKVELDRLKAIAEVNARGAAIMANMAEGAMSAANGVAGAIFEEF
jgi:hypothetical protein